MFTISQVKIQQDPVRIDRGMSDMKTCRYAHNAAVPKLY